MPDTKTYKVGDDIYDIPIKEESDFLKEYPKAQKVQSFVAGKDTFDIPDIEVNEFLKAYPEAKPLKKKEVSQPFGVSSDQALPLESLGQESTSKSQKTSGFRTIAEKRGYKQKFQYEETPTEIPTMYMDEELAEKELEKRIDPQAIAIKRTKAVKKLEEAEAIAEEARKPILEKIGGKKRTVLEFVKDFGIKPEELEHLQNPQQILSTEDQEEYLGIVDFKRYTQKKTDEYLNRPEDSYFWGVIGGINKATARTLRTMDGAAKLLNDLMPFISSSGSFGEAADYIEEMVATSPKQAPKNIGGMVAEGFGSLLEELPLMVLAPETRLSYMGKVRKIPGIVSYMATTNALRTYEELDKTGAPDWEKIKDTGIAFGEGAAEGYLMEAFGFVSGKTGKLVKGITDSNIAGKVASSVTNGTLFGGMTATEQYLSGKVNPQEVISSAILGAGLDLVAGKSLKENLKSVQKKATDRFFTTSVDDIVKINDLPITVDKLREWQIEVQERANKETDLERKEQLQIASQTLDGYVDIKAVNKQILTGPASIIKSIKDDPKLSDTEKGYYVNKINEVVAKTDPRLQAIKPLTDEIDRIDNNIGVTKDNTSIPDNVKQHVIEGLEKRKEDLAKDINNEMSKPVNVVELNKLEQSKSKDYERKNERSYGRKRSTSTDETKIESREGSESSEEGPKVKDEGKGKKLLKPEEYAESVRSDEGQIQERGSIVEKSKNESGEDLQRQEETRTKTSNQKVGQKKEIKISSSQINSDYSIQRDRMKSVNGVQSEVNRLVNNKKIFKSVISSVPVDVMNAFSRGKLSSEEISSNKDVFHDILSSDPNSPVSRSVIKSIMSKITSIGTELFDSLSAGRYKEFDSTVKAFDLDSSEVVGLISLNNRKGLSMENIKSVFSEAAPRTILRDIISVRGNEINLPTEFAKLFDTHVTNIRKNFEETGRSRSIRKKAKIVEEMPEFVPEGKAKPEPAGTKSGITKVSPETLKTEPEYFQYKPKADIKGVTEKTIELPTEENPVTVWKEGNTIIEGYNKLNRAKAEGMKEIPIEYVSAKTKEEALAKAAAKNIQKGELKGLTETEKGYKIGDTGLEVDKKGNILKTEPKIGDTIGYKDHVGADRVGKILSIEPDGKYKIESEEGIINKIKPENIQPVEKIKEKILENIKEDKEKQLKIALSKKEITPEEYSKKIETINQKRFKESKERLRENLDRYFTKQAIGEEKPSLGELYDSLVKFIKDALSVYGEKIKSAKDLAKLTDSKYNKLFQEAYNEAIGKKGIDKNQKLRGFPRRIKEFEEFKDLKVDIETKPELRYTPQSIKDVKSRISEMTDIELIKASEDAGLKIFSESSENIGVLAYIERINRARAKNEDIMPILTEVSEKGTSWGQLIRQFAEMKGTIPENVTLTIEKLLEKENRFLTEEQKIKLTDLAEKDIRARQELKKQADLAKIDFSEENINKYKELEKVAEKAYTNLANHVQSIVPKKFWDMMGMVVQGNLLTPLSQITNIYANLMNIPIHEAATVLVTPVDAIHTMITGGLKVTTLNYKAQIEGLKGFGYGIKEASKQLFTGVNVAEKVELQRGFKPFKSLYQVFSKEGRKELPVGKKGVVPASDYAKKIFEGIVGVPPEIMFRLLNFGDKPFYRRSERIALYTIGYNKGLRGESLEKFIKFPDLKSQEIAINRAKEATFQEESETAKAALQIANVANRITEEIPVIGPATKFIIKTQMPYIKTPANIISQTLDIAIPPISFGKGIYHSIKKNKREALISYGKAGVGLIITSTAHWLLENGLLSGSPDEEKKKRNLQYENLPPNSIDLTGLKKILKGENPSYKQGEEREIINFTKMGLVGMVFGIQSNIYEREKEFKRKEENKKLSDIAINAISSLLEIPAYSLEQSFLKGTSSLITAINDKQWDYWLTNTFNAISSIPLPNTLAAINRAKREYIPDLKGDSLEERLSNVIRNKTFQTENLPLIRNLWGEPVKQTHEGSNSWLYQLFDVTKHQELITKPESNFIYELYKTTQDADVIPSVPQRKIIHDNKDVKLNSKEYEKYLEITGKKRFELLSKALNNKKINRLSNEQKIKLLNKLWEAGLQEGKYKILESKKMLTRKNKMQYLMNKNKSIDYFIYTSMR